MTTRRRARSGKHRRRSIPYTAVGLLAGSAAAVLAVVSVSGAAFSGTTENAANSWTAGSVTLTDNDSGSAMFNVEKMLPGQSFQHCITVTYTGTTDGVSPIRLYAALTDAGDLAPYLKVTVKQGAKGTADVAADCSDFPASPTTIVTDKTLTAVTTDHTNFGNGVGGVTPSTTDTKVPYQFVVTLDPSTPNTAQGKTAKATFTWEIQSTV